MSLDLLISKYLDGDLSREEDDDLRQLLKQNSSARDEFDAAVLLNAAFAESAKSIKAPDDLVWQTEDIVLMKIMSAYETPVASRVIRPKRQFNFRPAYAFILAVLMIGGVFSINNISDYQYRTANQAANTDLQQSKANSIANQALAETIAEPKIVKNSIDNRIIPVKKTNAVTDQLAKTNMQASAPIADPETIAIQENSKIIVEQLNNKANSLSSNENANDKSASADIIRPSSNATQSLNSNSLALLGSPQENRLIELNNSTRNMGFQSTTTMMDLASFDPFSSNSDVNVATFFSNDIANPKRNLKGSKSIQSISQSVAYSMNDQSSFGLELGTIEYGYDFNTTLKVSTGTGGLQSKIEVLDPTKENDLNIYLPITLNRQTQSFWVATFWDYKFLDGELLSLQSRLGGGFSSEGVLFYGRLYGKMHLYKGIYFTAGGEAKSFNAKLTGMKNGTIGTGSIIYGLQLKF